MESEFILKATDAEAKHLCDNYCVKWIRFKCSMNYYDGMPVNWDIILRHPESIGEIKGKRTYRTIIRLLNRAYAKQV